MRCYRFCIFLVALFGLQILALAQEEGTTGAVTDHWVIQQPYGKQNPTKRGLLAGTASSGDHSGRAVLTVDCGGDGTRTIGVRVRDKELGFDLSTFEGEDSIGMQKKLFRFAIANNPATFRNVGGGSKEDEFFALGFNPSLSELRLLISPASAGKPVIVTVQPPDGKGAPLVIHFQLPSDSAPLQTATAPCRAHS